MFIFGVIVVVLIGAFLAYAATRPDTLRVERSKSISAPPDRIFALINDFERWGPWSPWEKKDPAMRRTFGGAVRGVGSVYEWDGNRDIGKGRMEITQSTPSSRIVIQLDFIKPFEAHNIVEFTLEPVADATHVKWVMQGPSPLLSKVMGIFINMDKMIGKDFEEGLANLKRIAEKS